jgi:ZIP family zinc transporter
MVLLTALGVGGATLIGAVLGFIFKNISHKFSDIVLSFAAGVMLAASVIGLILPSVEYAAERVELWGFDANWGFAITIIGMFCGALCINVIDTIVPHLHNIAGANEEKHPEMQSQMNKTLLFVIAIGIHNLPEGLAAGVGFGTGNVSEALVVASGIALQNVPEGMVIIAPMIGLGMSKKKTLLIAAATGFVEVVGTLLGYFAVTLTTAILPFALAFAGGTMLYVISDEMLLETHAHGSERAATYALLVGFCLMLIFDTVLG